MTDVSNESSIWILNYKPTISNLKIDKNLKTKIKNYVGADKTLPFNLLFNGIQGIGKLTIIKAILNEINDNLEDDKPDILSNLQEYHDVPFLFYHQNIYFVNFNLVKSNNEIDLILKKIKKISSSRGIYSQEKHFVLLHIDTLSLRNQINLSITLEKYANNIRILATSNKLLKIIPKLKGLVGLINIPPLTDKLFLSLVKSVIKKYNITKLDDFSTNKKMKSNVIKIYINNQKSIKNSLLLIQNIYSKKETIIYKPSFLSEKIIKLFDYLDKISFNNLNNLRNYMFHLLGIGLKPSQILNKLIEFIGNNKMINDSKKLEIVGLFASNEMLLNKCDRDFYIIENCLFKLSLILNK